MFVDDEDFLEEEEPIDDADEGVEDDPVDDEDEGSDEDEPSDEADPEDSEEPPAKPSRADDRVAKATRAAKEARETSARLERELAEARGGRQTESQQAAVAERKARLDAMEPEDRLTYLINESEQRTQAHLRQLQYENWEASNRNDFEARCARNPILAKVQDDVEKKFRELKAKGQVTDRDTIAKFIIGERALAGASKAGTKQRKAAAVAKDRQASRPVNSRSDVSAGSGKRLSEAAARKKRLEGQLI